MDTTLVDDSLEGVLDQFKGGRLLAMIERAGQPTIASAVDTECSPPKRPSWRPPSRLWQKRTEKGRTASRVCDL